MYFENPLHPGERFVRTGDLYSHSLGTVNTGTSAKADDSGTVMRMIKAGSLIYVSGSWIGHCFIVNDIGNMLVSQCAF